MRGGRGGSCDRKFGTTCTEMSEIICTWLREVCSCCSLTVLPGPAWVLLNHVLQRILLISVELRYDEVQLLVGYKLLWRFSKYPMVSLLPLFSVFFSRKLKFTQILKLKSLNLPRASSWFLETPEWNAVTGRGDCTINALLPLPSRASH